MREAAIKEQQWQGMKKALGWDGTSEAFEEHLRARLGQYPVFCAWCGEKGLKTRTGWSSVPHSHGICEACRREMQDDIENWERRSRVV